MQRRSWRRGRQAITAAAAAIAIAGAGADGRIANCPPSGTRCGGNGALHLVTRHRHGSWCRGVACQCRGLGVPSQAFDGLQGILGSSLNSSRCHHVRVLHVQAAAAEHEHRQHGVPHYPHGVPAEARGRRFHPWPRSRSRGRPGCGRDLRGTLRPINRHRIRPPNIQPCWPSPLSRLATSPALRPSEPSARTCAWLW
jgi:hypothetical protein